jgi:hypothetical protein
LRRRALRFIWSRSAAPALLVLAVALELRALPVHTWMDHLAGHNARFCMNLILFFSIGPLICIFIALRRRAPTHPRLIGAVAGLPASGIGATYYASHCNDDSPLFVVTRYALATLIIVLVASFADGRPLCW